MSYEQAVKIYSNVFLWTTSRWGNLRSFRRIAKIGLEHTRNQILTESLQASLWIHTNDDLFIDKDAAFKLMGGIKGFARTLEKRDIDNQLFSIDAASLIFAHTILDQASLDYCKVTSFANQSKWEFAIKDRTIKVSEIKSSSYNLIVRQKLDHYFSALERESLIKKIDLIHQVCQPDNSEDVINNYSYDRDLLVSLNNIRNDIVHGKDVNNILPNGEEDLIFLERTSLYLMALVNEHFGVKIDPSQLIKKPTTK